MKVAQENTHSEERLDNELKELGRSPEKLLKERSLQSQAGWNNCMKKAKAIPIVRK